MNILAMRDNIFYIKIKTISTIELEGQLSCKLLALQEDPGLRTKVFQKKKKKVGYGSVSL